jgi:hypothetical protein
VQLELIAARYRQVQSVEMWGDASALAKSFEW